MLRSLVGSEMCIRDSYVAESLPQGDAVVLGRSILLLLVSSTQAHRPRKEDSSETTNNFFSIVINSTGSQAKPVQNDRRATKHGQETGTTEQSDAPSPRFSLPYSTREKQSGSRNAQSSTRRRLRSACFVMRGKSESSCEANLNCHARQRACTIENSIQ